MGGRGMPRSLIKWGFQIIAEARGPGPGPRAKAGARGRGPRLEGLTHSFIKLPGSLPAPLWGPKVWPWWRSQSSGPHFIELPGSLPAPLWGPKVWPWWHSQSSGPHFIELPGFLPAPLWGSWAPPHRGTVDVAGPWCLGFLEVQGLGPV